jgi:hypothetical protein
MDVEDKRRELARLKTQVEQLETELATVRTAATRIQPFRPPAYYTAYFATTGFMLGALAAIASLLLNIGGSLLIGQHPLELIRVYLTFPLGDRALQVDSGLTLAFGCCLYIGTGMLLGIPFYLALTRWTPQSSFWSRMVLVSVLSVAVWGLNFYGILSWLQPLVVNMSPQNLIVNKIPVWVGLLTHLVFGWTMVLVYPLGQMVPYRRVTEAS